MRVWRGVANFVLLSSGGIGLGAGACGARTGLSSEQCVELDAIAERASLVAFVILDTSGSMQFETSEGVTKAKAVRDALADFYADPGSAGIGIAETFFPVQRVEIPESCTDDTQCGEVGACSLHTKKICLPSEEKECETDSDCAGTSDPSDKCYQWGACADDPEKFCVFEYADLFCNLGTECVFHGSCLNKSSCDVANYATPVVAVGNLPEARAELLLALDVQTPDGATPTWPALKGAISTASAWQDAHPRDKAIVLLATDGLPTVCDPALVGETELSTKGIPKLVEAAQAGVDDGVQTFVVGVFSPEEKSFAESALGQIAFAGATTSAFIVTTDEAVSKRLVDTFNEIRNRAHECEYPIPWPTTGGIDAASLEVTIASSSSGNAPMPIERVDSAGGCGALGGFYFDRPPAPGLLPHRIVLCPTTCGPTPPNSLHLKGRCREVLP